MKEYSGKSISKIINCINNDNSAFNWQLTVFGTPP